MKEIIVPFQNKKVARTLGAVFNLKTRKWEIPDDMDPEVADFLCNLCDIEEIVEEEIETQQPDSIKSDMVLPTNSIHINAPSNDWSTILASDDTLIATMAVRDFGLPDTENERASLLKILGKRRDSDYVVSYDSLCGCSEVFASTYPISLVTKLVQENVTAQNRYVEEIRTSMRLSEEEKALLLFALPA